MTSHTIHHGPAAETIRRHVQGRSVDMVYIDPPFFTQQTWTGAAGAFADKWAWDAAAERREAALARQAPEVATGLRAVAMGRQRAALLAYLLAMEEIIHACHRTLRPHGTFWLHCDDHAAAHLRVACDVVFGPHRLMGISFWKRSTASAATKKGFQRSHDTILTYARTGAALSRLRPPGTLRMDGCGGSPIREIFDARLTATSGERAGYPTQKPVALLQQIIRLGSRPGDTVLDPCTGSGTTLVAARTTDRASIGIDQSDAAVALASRRLGEISGIQLNLFGDAA